MFGRKFTTADIGTNRKRYRVVITGDDCPPPPTNEARRQQQLFLQALADPMQQLLICGYSFPSRITITHNGTCWQADAEAEVDEQP
jgi:hypothetical protein